LILYQIFLGISNSKSVSRREVNDAWQKTLRPVTGTGMDRLEIGRRFTTLLMTAGQNGIRTLENLWTRRRTINLLREFARKIKLASSYCRVGALPTLQSSLYVIVGSFLLI
jgi:predicted unusual protein kinase regulating ubiquinone biosynthesis (AarF/ABC1/UbiB family)